MKHDDFRLQYELLERLVSGEITTYAGMDFAGEPVMVHYLRGSPERNRELLGHLNRLPEDGRRCVREMAELDGVPLVITSVLPDFESLETWIADQSGSTRLAAAAEISGDLKPAPADSLRPTAGEPEPDEFSAPEPPGEYTRLFVLGEAAGLGEEAGLGTVGSEAEAAQDEPTEVASGVEESEEGEAVARPTEPPSGTGEQVSGPSASPGEFTRLFALGGPPSEASSEEASAAESEEEPSEERPSGQDDRDDREDTAVEAMPPTEEPPHVDVELADAAETPIGSAEAPGEFTRLFSVSELDREAAAASRQPDSSSPEASDQDGGTTGALDQPPREEPQPPRDESEPPDVDSVTEQGVGADEDEGIGAVEDDGTEGRESTDTDEPTALEPKPTEAPGPGEFTRRFGSPDAPPQRKERQSSWRDEAPSGLEPPGKGTDEYLKQLGATPPRQADPSVAPHDAAIGPATPPGPSTPPPPAPSFTTPSGPSEYTKIIRGDAPGMTPPPGPPLSTPPAAAPASAQDAPAKKPQRRWPYIAGLVAVAVLALGLILFFALRGGSDDTPPAEEIPETEEVVSPQEEEG
jgi:hypothetical protein